MPSTARADGSTRASKPRARPRRLGGDRSGRGRAFCAGNDIAEIRVSAPRGQSAVRAVAAIMDRFARLPSHHRRRAGYALGGGCMLAAAQDLRIAERSAHSASEITLGFNPSYGIARLLDILGGAHARDLLLTGRRIDAAEALRIGLVTQVVPDGALDEAAAARAAEIARHPRSGIAATKSVIADIRAGRTGAEAQAYAAALRADPEARARIAAFVAKSTNGTRAMRRPICPDGASTAFHVNARQSADEFRLRGPDMARPPPRASASRCLPRVRLALNLSSL